MSVIFLITPPEGQKQVFQVDLAKYRAKLLERWPDVLFPNMVPGSDMLLEWALPNGVWAMLHKDRQTISFGLTPEDKRFTEFIIWYRAYVPADIKLSLFDSSSSNELQLRFDTTAQNILNFVYEN